MAGYSVLPVEIRIGQPIAWWCGVLVFFPGILHPHSPLPSVKTLGHALTLHSSTCMYFLSPSRRLHQPCDSSVDFALPSPLFFQVGSPSAMHNRRPLRGTTCGQRHSIGCHNICHHHTDGIADKRTHGFVLYTFSSSEPWFALHDDPPLTVASVTVVDAADGCSRGAPLRYRQCYR